METRDSLWPPAKDTDPQSFITFSLNGHFKLNKKAKKKEERSCCPAAQLRTPEERFQADWLSENLQINTARRVAVNEDNIGRRRCSADT